MNIPWSDWQFWVVTAAALGGVIFMWRMIAPSRKKGVGCPTCASGSAAATKKHSVSVTVGGKRV